MASESWWPAQGEPSAGVTKTARNPVCILLTCCRALGRTEIRSGFEHCPCHLFCERSWVFSLPAAWDPLAVNGKNNRGHCEGFGEVQVSQGRKGTTRCLAHSTPSVLTMIQCATSNFCYSGLSTFPTLPKEGRKGVWQARAHHCLSLSWILRWLTDCCWFPGNRFFSSKWQCVNFHWGRHLVWQPGQLCRERALQASL